MDKNIFNLPNSLTIMRFLFSPLFFYFLYVQEIELALITFMFVAVTDFADGWIARKTKQKTRFGQMLDPMADKFMIILALIALTLRFGFPLWAIPLVLSRDIISLCGTLLVFVKHRGVWRSNRIGKTTTFLQIIVVLAFIIDIQFKLYILWLTILFSILTAITYFWRGVRILLGKQHQ